MAELFCIKPCEIVSQYQGAAILSKKPRQQKAQSIFRTSELRFKLLVILPKKKYTERVY
ncbi:MAG: hypothetical protein K2P63_10305 [Lachnospiraceae bacterium]|nr:hypothetical protein [Lachnospiraceae bacterium]